MSETPTTAIEGGGISSGNADKLPEGDIRFSDPENTDLDTGSSDGESDENQELPDAEEMGADLADLRERLEKKKKKDDRRAERKKAKLGTRRTLGEDAPLREGDPLEKALPQLGSDKGKGKMLELPLPMPPIEEEEEGENLTEDAVEVVETVDAVARAEMEEDEEFVEAQDLFDKLKKAEYLGKNVKAPKDLRNITRKDAQGRWHVDLRDGEVTVEVGENGELKEDGTFKMPKPKKLLCPRVREVVLQLYSFPQNRGLPVKRNIYKSSTEPDWFTKRGDIAEASPLRNYTAGEMGMHQEIMEWLSQNMTQTPGTAQTRNYQNPHAKADGTAATYGPRKQIQARGRSGKFGANVVPAPFEPDKEYNPFNQDMQAPLVVKAALLYAIKQGLVSAKDLGMERLGGTWKRLQTAAVAILERQVELEEWVNQQRALINVRVDAHRKAKLDIQRKAKKIEAFNGFLQDFVGSQGVRDALKTAGIEIPEELLKQLPSNLRIPKGTSSNMRQVLGRDRRSQEIRKALQSTAKRSALAPTLKIAPAAIYGKNATNETRAKVEAALKMGESGKSRSSKGDKAGAAGSRRPGKVTKQKRKAPEIAPPLEETSSEGELL